MTILLVQIFVLMLAAFLLGAAVAYLFRRALMGQPRAKSAVAAPASATTGATPAFAPPPQGDHAAVVAPPHRPASVPMIEVQPAPQPSPDVAEQRAPVKELARPTPPPARPAMPAAPAAPPAPAKQAPAPVPSPTPSYAAIAVAAAAASVATSPTRATPAPSAPAPFPAREAPVARDDLTRIRSIGADTQKRLNELGIHRFEDIAKWAPDDVTRVSQALGNYGRVEQENWIEQAQILAKGGDTDYSRRKAPGATEPSSPGANAIAAAAPASPAATPGADRLHRIMGIDAETEKLLIANGVTRYAQIAAWTSTDVETVEGVLGRPGRVGLENWIEQAKILMRSANGEHARPVLSGEPRLGATVTPAAEPPRAPRHEIQGLRSVRSEALRRETIGTIPPAIGVFDDLKRIRGIGVLIEKKLNSLGVTLYEQIANWTGADVDRISQILDFKGRIERESWVEQARILASGGDTEFSRRADRGEVETSRNPRN
jgi:predicted flap endonuclease-1-like 5' DNA nuclease